MGIVIQNSTRKKKYVFYLNHLFFAKKLLRRLNKCYVRQLNNSKLKYYLIPHEHH